MLRRPLPIFHPHKIYRNIKFCTALEAMSPLTKRQAQKLIEQNMRQIGKHWICCKCKAENHVSGEGAIEENPHWKPRCAECEHEKCWNLTLTWCCSSFRV